MELEHCLYNSPVPWVERRTEKLKCLAQKHNTMILLSAASGPLGVIETASRCSAVSRQTSFFGELFFTITECFYAHLRTTFEDKFTRYI